MDALLARARRRDVRSRLINPGSFIVLADLYRAAFLAPDCLAHGHRITDVPGRRYAIG